MTILGGSHDFKCLCKHSYRDHDPRTRKCKKPGCKKCPRGGFASKWSCGCGHLYEDHRLVFETRAERIAKGKPVEDLKHLRTPEQQQAYLLK